MPVAPLTNIAAALTLYPKLAELVPEVVIMGGGHAIGNVTPSAEFNIWADPEAAAVVFSAGFRKLTLVPLDATHRALVSRDDCAALRALGTPAGQAAATLSAVASAAHDESQRMGGRGIRRRSMMRCAWPRSSIRSIITTRRHHVAVETTGALTVGRTVIDTHVRGGGAAAMRRGVRRGSEALCRDVDGDLRLGPHLLPTAEGSSRLHRQPLSSHSCAGSL